MQTTSTYPGTAVKDAMKDFASSTNPAPVTGMADVAAKAAQSARDIMEDSRKTVRDLLHDGKTVAAQGLDATTHWVGTATRENPMRTLGIVAAVGVILGLLMGRR